MKIIYWHSSLINGCSNRVAYIGVSFVCLWQALILGGSSGHSSLIEVRTAHDLLVEFPLLGLLLSIL